MTQHLVGRTHLPELNEGWESRRVGEMGDVLAGKALNVNGAGPLRPYLRTKNVLDGRIDLRDVLRMPMTDAEFERFRIVCGDVLLNEGQTLDLIGRCSIYNDEFGTSCAMQNQLLRFRPHVDTSPEFAAHLFRYCQRTRKFSAIATQTTSVAHLGSLRFSNLTLIWPISRLEQVAIAEALTDIDDLISALERMLTKKQAIKQGMMQQLLTGKTRLPGYSDPWIDVRLGEVVQFGKGMGLPKSSLEMGGRFPCIHYGELFTYYGVEIVSVASRTNDPTCRVVSAALDVLMPTSDVTPRGLAKASSVLDSGVVLGGDILVIRPLADRLFGPFLAHAIRLDVNQVLQLVRGSTVFHLYAADMKTFRFKIPAPAEQRAICDVLRDFQLEVDAFQSQLAKALAVKQGMMQELLTGHTRLPVVEGTP